MAIEAESSGQTSALRIVALQNAQSFSAWRQLSIGQYSVGGSLTNDIALAGCHSAELFVLSVEQVAFNRRQLSITALDDGLEINGQKLTIGEPVLLDPQSSVESGQHRFEFSNGLPRLNSAYDDGAEGGEALLPATRFQTSVNGLSAQNRMSLSDTWQVRAKGASLLLAAAGFLLFAGFASLGTRAYFQAGSSPLGQNSMAALSTGKEVSLGALRALLFDLDFGQSIKINEKSGKIFLSGELTEEQAARLKIALLPYGNKVMANIKFKPNANHGVAGVFLKPREFVIANDGRLISEGGLLKSGWRIEKISRSGVVLSKNGQSLIAPIGAGELTTGSIKAKKSSVQWQMRGTLRSVN